MIRNFEIIGEVAHNIERYHAEFAANYPDVPWTVVYAMRNRVAHGYFNVDLEMVWKWSGNGLENYPRRPAGAARTDKATARRNQVSLRNIATMQSMEPTA